MTNSYEAPSISSLGSLESLTAGGKVSGLSDALYPVGTPSGALLFS